MNIMLLGYGRSGKGTFCTVAEKMFGITSIASSRMACELYLFDLFKDKFGYATVDECYADRHNHRELWYREIQNLNTPDKTTLGRQIYARHPIYDGCRDRDEFEALKAAGLIDLVIWVDAGDRVPPESEKSMNLTIDDADIVIRNYGDEASYLLKVERLIRSFTVTIKPVANAAPKYIMSA